VLLIGIALFCLLFFGGLWILNRRPDIQRSQLGCGGDVASCLGVTLATGRHFKPTSSVTKPWFAQNVDVTAPGATWWTATGQFQMPHMRLFIIALTIVCVAGIYSCNAPPGVCGSIGNTEP